MKRCFTHVAGCDPNVLNKKEESALYLASRAGKIKFVRELLGHKADANVCCGRENHTPLVAAIANEHADVAMAIIKVLNCY